MEECFEDLTSYVHAVETGLSSDPPMNWRLSALDGLQLISNSDAHSPSSLEERLTYWTLNCPIRDFMVLSNMEKVFLEHWNFSRKRENITMMDTEKCHICLSPEEAEKYHGICPICGKKLTMGSESQNYGSG